MEQQSALNEVIKQTEQLKKRLKIRPGCSLEELVKRVETICRGEIKYLPAALPNWLCGFTSSVSTGYLIKYDQTLRGRERLNVIGHELGHILNGDVGIGGVTYCFRHTKSDDLALDEIKEKKAELTGFYLVADVAIDEYDATTSQWFG